MVQGQIQTLRGGFGGVECGPDNNHFCSWDSRDSRGGRRAFCTAYHGKHAATAQNWGGRGGWKISTQQQTQNKQTNKSSLPQTSARPHMSTRHSLTIHLRKVKSGLLQYHVLTGGPSLKKNVKRGGGVLCWFLTLLPPCITTC